MHSLLSSLFDFQRKNAAINKNTYCLVQIYASNTFQNRSNFKLRK